MRDSMEESHRQGVWNAIRSRQGMKRCIHAYIYIVKELSDTMHCIIRRAMGVRSRYEMFRWNG